MRHSRSPVVPEAPEARGEWVALADLVEWAGPADPMVRGGKAVPAASLPVPLVALGPWPVEAHRR